MIQVLYVDDEEGMLEIGKLFLERTGQFGVTTISSAPAALALLRKKKFDVIVSDYQMPEMDGIFFLKTVRSADNRIPFILFTGWDREKIIIPALDAGADFYVRKGFDAQSQFAELRHKILASLERRRAVDALENSEQRIADIIDFLPVALFAIDTAGIVTLWNRAMEDMTGVMASDILGKGDYEYAVPLYRECRPMLADLVQSPDEAFEKAMYPCIIRNHRTLAAEIRLTNPDGSSGTIWETARCLFDRNEHITGAIEMIRNNADTNRAE